MKKTVNMKKLVLVAMILTLSGCATVDGFGRDEFLKSQAGPVRYLRIGLCHARGVRPAMSPKGWWHPLLTGL
jgi:predicted small secreted protein